MEKTPCLRSAFLCKAITGYFFIAKFPPFFHAQAMQFLISIILNTLSVLLTSYILSGIHLRNFFTALLVAIVLAIVNTILRPIIFILTLPINIITLGLFSFVIMGALVYLVSWLVPGFVVDNFWWAMAFGIIVSFINWLIVKGLASFNHRRW